MHPHKVFTITALTATLLVPSVSLAAASANRPPCILNEHRVTSVKPYTVTEQIGHGTYQRLRGADVYVLAEPGLTAEWLELKLQQHLQAMNQADMRDCAFDVKNVAIDVDSAGNGFRVRFIAKSPGGAKEVLRRARLLVD